MHRRDMPLDAPVDAQGRVDAARLPLLDEHTILCLQAGEVNTGAFDPFDPIIPLAKKVEAGVHVDGAFGLWARASSLAHLTQGIELADSWTTDAQTRAVLAAVRASGEVWFSDTVWQGRPAMRISVSSWRTRDADIDVLLALLARLGRSIQ